MPSRFRHRPPGAIRAGFAGWNPRTGLQSCASFWNSLSHGWKQPWFFGQFQFSFPAQLSGSSPLRSCSLKREDIPLGE